MKTAILLAKINRNKILKIFTSQTLNTLSFNLHIINLC